MRWTEDQLADHLKRTGVPAPAQHVDVSDPPFKPMARGKMPEQGMNKTEAAYAQHLEARKLAGEVLWYRYEAIKVRLADGAYYTPDFAVLTSDCMLECHETKGFWREAARVRIKVAAEAYPFKFIAIKRVNGGWEREAF